MSHQQLELEKKFLFRLLMTHIPNLKKKVLYYLSHQLIYLKKKVFIFMLLMTHIPNLKKKFYIIELSNLKKKV